jgi:hypothetical protein
MGSFQENPREIRIMRSTNHGNSYGDERLLYSGVMANPHVLTKGDDEVFVFAQSEDDPTPGRGLVMNHSTDSGLTWSGWTLIDATCNYFDPTAAIDVDGNIYVAGRRDNGTGEVGTTCGDSSRMGMLKSTDNGGTWTVEQWLSEMERAGTQTKLRYQTWHTGGGILEWIWMNELSDGTTPIFYNNNSEVIIMTPNQASCSSYIDQTTCESNGCNYCNNVCQNSACVEIRADVNQDGNINITDAQLILRQTLGLDMTSTNWQTTTTTGDVNCDNTTNTADAQLILRYSLGLNMTGTGWCIN